MGILKCGKCGVPRLISLMHRWRDDGVLESRMGAARGVFIEKDAFTGSLDRVEKALGVPIDHIIIDAKRRDAKLYVDDVVSGPIGALARLRPLRRLGYTIMIHQAAAIGLAKARILEYKPGVRFAGCARPAYHDVLFVGDVCGAYESIERKRGRPAYGVIGDTLYMELLPDESLPDEERLELEKTPEVPARADHVRCPSCGVPRHMAGFRWALKEGRIYDRNTGEWIIYIDVEGLNTILRELEEELGETIPGLVAEHSFHYYRGILKGCAGAGFSDLAFLKARGLGVPEADDPTAEQLSAGIDIRNAFNAPIIAGMVAAVCGGDMPEYAWEVPEPGVVRVKVGKTREP